MQPVCRGGKAVGNFVLVIALVTSTSWSDACTGGVPEVRFLGETPLWQVKRSNWQHHVYWRKHTTVYSLPGPTVGRDKDHWQCRREKRRIVIETRGGTMSPLYWLYCLNSLFLVHTMVRLLINIKFPSLAVPGWNPGTPRSFCRSMGTEPGSWRDRSWTWMTLLSSSMCQFQTCCETCSLFLMR